MAERLANYIRTNSWRLALRISAEDLTRRFPQKPCVQQTNIIDTTKIKPTTNKPEETLISFQSSK